ncbi:DUF4253 domain-containing protein [Chitinilyticum aquatile]|uniref:DUF4253 domain-containing protein n=1 Tax=Chitinilyticum aquatile TaxID=362520 RepID=UPI0003FB8769|nr:DUF4253 domain-containing protein [Chitinilyticum aquatile]
MFKNIAALAGLLVSLCVHFAQAAPVPAEARKQLAAVSAAAVRNYSTRDFGRDKYPGAISAIVPEASAPAKLAELRRRLPQGLVAFIGTSNSLAERKVKGVELVVGHGSSAVDILEIAQTDAANYGMYPKDVQRKIAAWDKLYGVDVWQAETDTIQLKFRKLPPDLKRFAKELYEFCPDVVDQGVGSLAALEQALREQHGAYLWWD